MFEGASKKQEGIGRVSGLLVQNGKGSASFQFRVILSEAKNPLMRTTASASSPVERSRIERSTQYKYIPVYSMRRSLVYARDDAAQNDTEQIG